MLLRVVHPPDAESRAQRTYYAMRAAHYDEAHVQANDEHQLALAFMVGAIQFLDVRSVLDVGSGTGRVLTYLKTHAPAVARAGVEPVGELRQVAYGKGVSEAELRDGDATRLAFPEESFDLVSEFGMLHHVRDHARVVREMLRVASKAIFISDSNNFGQGSRLKRAAKQALRSAGLWRAADLVKTRGKGYSITEGDGLSYSYSVFDDYELIRANCRSVHVLNTQDADVNPYRSASHVALLGIK
ncbi:MAG TPA: class I SAM-dependent methyltransferase [Polyangiaceae bacterium]|jgi:ubiquinone/menaquinone biosynthesis C-methylase UbiE